MSDYSPVIADLESRRNAIDQAINLLRELNGTSSTPVSVPTHNGKPHRKKQSIPKPEKSDAEGRPSPTRDAVLLALKKGPLTSIEAFDALKKTGVETTAGSVYQTLHSLHGKGIIEKVINEEGRNAWKLV